MRGEIPYQTEMDYGDLLCAGCIDEDPGGTSAEKENRKAAGKDGGLQIIPVAPCDTWRGKPHPGTAATPDAASGAAAQDLSYIVDDRPRGGAADNAAAERERKADPQRGFFIRQRSLHLGDKVKHQRQAFQRSRTLPGGKSALNKSLPATPANPANGAGRNFNGVTRDVLRRAPDSLPSPPPTPVAADPVKRKPSVVKRAFASVFRRKSSKTVDRPTA